MVGRPRRWHMYIQCMHGFIETMKVYTQMPNPHHIGMPCSKDVSWVIHSIIYTVYNTLPTIISHYVVVCIYCESHNMYLSGSLTYTQMQNPHHLHALIPEKQSLLITAAVTVGRKPGYHRWYKTETEPIHNKRFTTDHWTAGVQFLQNQDLAKIVPCLGVVLLLVTVHHD